MKQQDNVLRVFYSLNFETNLSSNKLFSCIFGIKMIAYTAEKNQIIYLVQII